MTTGAQDRLAAEARARVLIDAQLEAAGWVVQDRKQLNLFAAQGVAVREVIMKPGHGRADYLLYVEQRAVGVIEAKPAPMTTTSSARWVGVRSPKIARRRASPVLGGERSVQPRPVTVDVGDGAAVEQDGEDGL